MVADRRAGKTRQAVRGVAELDGVIHRSYLTVFYPVRGLFTLPKVQTLVGYARIC
jgi:hypothetical protein